MGITKSKTVRLPIELASKLEDLAKTENYPSETSIVSKALQQFFDSLQKKGEPLTLDLALQATLGDELHQRHLTFLEKEKQEGENLEDVFCRFIERAGVQITKEEWLERIKEGERVDHFKILDPSPCHYRAINEKGEWFCDVKKIDPAVCIKRQGRFQHMGRRCKPVAQKRAPASQGRGRGITIPKTTYCYAKKEKVSIREVCYNKENPCDKTTYCRSLNYYKGQLEKARLRGQI